MNNEKLKYSIDSLEDSLDRVRQYMIAHKSLSENALADWKSLKDKTLKLDELSINQRRKISKSHVVICNSSTGKYEFCEDRFAVIKAVLSDIRFKFLEPKDNKESQEILKLLEARNVAKDFEYFIADMITGENTKFPKRDTLYKIYSFFDDLGYIEYDINPCDFDKEEEYYLLDYFEKAQIIVDKLEKLDTKNLYDVIRNGLFSSCYFESHFKQDSEKALENATLEFAKFIEESINQNKPQDISRALGMNFNIELLFKLDPKTDDADLNNLINEAKNRYIEGDNQIAIEKIWDAFERVKTQLDNNKKTSSTFLINTISDQFDKDFIEFQFKQLTKIGNDYTIRHHEKNKKNLTPNHLQYLFFTMVSLVDLCLKYLNKENKV